MSVGVETSLAAGGTDERSHKAKAVESVDVVLVNSPGNCSVGGYRREEVAGIVAKESGKEEGGGPEEVCGVKSVYLPSRVVLVESGEVLGEGTCKCKESSGERDHAGD